MLKEYRFRSNYEYYPFKNESGNAEYYVNGHKVNAELYYTLFKKAESKIPLDTSNMYIWKNHKTKSYMRSFCWTFNSEIYPWEEEKQSH